ncbi:MAG: OmpA family protein [Flavitalea sp.]
MMSSRTLYIFLLFISFGKGLYSQQMKDTSLTVFFATDVYALKDTQVIEINNFLSLVNGVKEITGYADTVGSLPYNRNLSRLRAISVYRILPTGIHFGKQPVYRGEEFVQNIDLAKNRKVEIVGFKRQDNLTDEVQSPDSLIDAFDIENINFIPDRPIITPESMVSIPRLVNRIKSYKNVRFEIIGHVNYQSKNDPSYLKDLFKLSVERAKLIYLILIDNGIAAKEIQYKGVGNSQPLIKAPVNDEERYKNMRVQILVFRR